MLLINCDLCGEKLTEPGALLITPPSVRICEKFHLCVACYTHLSGVFQAAQPLDTHEPDLESDDPRP